MGINLNQTQATSRSLTLLCDLTLITIYILFGMVVAEFAESEGFGNGLLARSSNGHLGAEYDAIAQSIFAGNGYSDAFRCESGPTAWMPPLLPFLLAGLYWLTDYQPTDVVGCVLGLKAISIALSGVIVLQESRRTNLLWFGQILVPLIFVSNFYRLFQFTHDFWLLLLIVNLIWVFSNKLPEPIGFLKAIAWGAFGGITALASPAIGTTWAAVSVCMLFTPVNSHVLGTKTAAFGHRFRNTHYPTQKANMVALATMGVMSIVIISPWIVRNYIVFGKIVPIKSNAGFELWQAQCADEDGVLDDVLLSKHPYVSDGELRQEYLRLGETQFISQKKSIAIDEIAKEPLGFLRRVLNRTVAATLIYQPGLHETTRIGFLDVLGKIFYPLPFVSACALCWNVRRLQRQHLIALTVYVTMLAPYVLISFGNRYAAPLLPIKALLIIYAVSFLIRRRS
jgi:hypothetical protein